MLLESDQFLPSGGLSLTCGDAECHGLFGARTEAGSELRAFTWKPGSATASKTTRLVGLLGSAESTAAVVVGSSIFYTDTAERRGRLERMEVDWQ